MTPPPQPARLNVTFAGGVTGPWRVDALRPVLGDALPSVSRLALLEAPISTPFVSAGESVWALRGFISNERYVTAHEREGLIAHQPPLGRREATQAALIPITKSAAWWQLAQDSRRAILEEQSHHIAVGMRYLPAVARRLHHSRDLGEPFDFLTWFEYAPSDAAAFEELLAALRATEEWRYVEREIDIRLTWAADYPRGEAPSQ